MEKQKTGKDPREEKACRAFIIVVKTTANKDKPCEAVFAIPPLRLCDSA